MDSNLKEEGYQEEDTPGGKISEVIPKGLCPLVQVVGDNDRKAAETAGVDSLLFQPVTVDVPEDDVQAEVDLPESGHHFQRDPNDRDQRHQPAEQFVVLFPLDDQEGVLDGFREIGEVAGKINCCKRYEYSYTRTISFIQAIKTQNNEMQNYMIARYKIIFEFCWRQIDFYSDNKPFEGTEACLNAFLIVLAVSSPCFRAVSMTSWYLYIPSVLIRIAIAVP